MVLLCGRLTSAAQPATKSGHRIVAVGAMREFLQTVARRKDNEYLAVLRDAEQRFPKGTVLEGFPELVSEQLPKQSPRPLLLAKAQMEKDGFDPEEMEAVTVFKGDNGILQVDIIIVLRKDSNAVAGVYGALWGR